MALSKDPGNGLWGTFSFLTKVTYGGVLGKVAALGIVFFLTLCVLVFAVRAFPILLGAVLITAIAGLVFLVSRIEAIFKSNPEMATLEGTEVIKYRQAELKSKNQGPVRVIELTTDPELSSSPSAVSISSPEQREEEQ